MSEWQPAKHFNAHGLCQWRGSKPYTTVKARPITLVDEDDIRDAKLHCDATRFYEIDETDDEGKFYILCEHEILTD